MLTEIAVSVSESPVSMVTDEFSAQLNSNVPELFADQNETSVSTSPLVPAQLVHAGWEDAATDPADGLPHETDGLVVTLDTFAVPAAPGAPVCSWTNPALATMVASAASAFATDRPSAMELHLLRAGHDPLAWLAACAARECLRLGAGVEFRAVAGA